MIIEGKKLLILGATTETVFLVKRAEELGVSTYVVDPYKDAPAKKFSSNPVDLNCFDVDSLLKLIEDEKIDGILPGCADILVPVYEEVCRKTNRYCYVNKETVEIFSNKKGLKEMLRKHNLPVIEEYSVEEVRNPEFNSYPIFIKPVDNNSSKGMSTVYEFGEFEDAYNKALENSKSKTVLIEKCEECDDFFLGYFLQDGNVNNTFTADRYVIKQWGYGTITAGMTYPSKHQQLYFDTVHAEMLSVFDELNFKNGIIAIQGFVEDGKIKFYDPALRITGGQEYILSKFFYDVDILECLIHFALTGKMAENQKEYEKCDASFGGKYASNLAFSVEGCTIGRIDGIDYAKNCPGVLNVTQEHKAGDVIDRVGTAQQNISRMHLVAGTREELRDLIKDLQKHVIAYDKNGNNVMLDGLDADKWFELN